MTDSTYLDAAVDRLLILLKQVMVDDGVVRAKSVQKYIYPLPGSYPFWVVYPGGTIFQGEEAGDPYELQTYTLICRYIVGKVGDGYDGGLLSKLWVYMPAVINYLGAHRDMFISTAHTSIAEMHPDGLAIGNVSRFGVFRDDPEHLGFEVPLTLTFHINNPDESV